LGCCGSGNLTLRPLVDIEDFKAHVSLLWEEIRDDEELDSDEVPVGEMSELKLLPTIGFCTGLNVASANVKKGKDVVSAVVLL
jgi:hypothetical protein